MLENRLNTEQIEKIIKTESHNINSFIKTLKYIYRSNSSANIKDVLSKNINKNPSAIGSLIWEIIKYFVISNELITIRKELFNMMFNKYSKPLDDAELVRIINNPSNQWLDNNHKKIELLTFYLDELIKNSNVCQEICNITNGSTIDYYNYRNLIINKLDTIKITAFNDFEKSEIQKLANKKQQLSSNYLPLSEQEGNNRKELYEKNFGDSSLLNTNKKEEETNV